MYDKNIYVDTVATVSNEATSCMYVRRRSIYEVNTIVNRIQRRSITKKLRVDDKKHFRNSDDEHFSFCAYYIGASSLLRRMGKCQDKNDDVEVTVVAVLCVVAFLL